MTPLVVFITASAASFALGALVGYLLRRPPRRRSSIELSINGPFNAVADGTGGNARERLPVLESVGSGQGMAMVLERLN